MGSISVQPKHNILFCLIIILLGMLVIEAVTRVLTRGPRWVNSYYVEMSKDFEPLDELILDNQKTYAAVKYYDEFLYATAPISLTHVNFTDYYSARRTPDSVPLSEADNIVWIFGGSTMQNQETIDELTIANTWARIFNHTLRPTHVKNFGAGSFFSSYELIKFQKILREVPENERPTVVIFYNGYNDANHSYRFGAGNMQRDLSLKLQALVERKNLLLTTYAISNWVSDLSKFWERTGARFVEYKLFSPAISQGQNDNLQAAIRVYINNVRMIKAICKTFNIQCFFVLQPLILTKTPLTPLENEVISRIEAHPNMGSEGLRFIRKFYEGVRKIMAEDDRFIDASHILDGRAQPDFYDLGHTGAKTSPVIGEKIADMILKRIKNSSPNI